jgi:hypothetical protein
VSESRVSFKKGLWGLLAIFLIAGTGEALAQSPERQFTSATNLTARNGRTPLPSPAADRGPSNIELLNQALNPGPSDPDVPLPHPDLSRSGGDQPIVGSEPRLFGRQEQGGGVFGLRMPIPAGRAAPATTTRYSRLPAILEGAPSPH